MPTPGHRITIGFVYGRSAAPLRAVVGCPASGCTPHPGAPDPGNSCVPDLGYTRPALGIWGPASVGRRMCRRSGPLRIPVPPISTDGHRTLILRFATARAPGKARNQGRFEQRVGRAEPTMPMH